MYEAFLTSPQREDLPRRARQIADKILSDTNQTIALVAAVQLLNEDLHVKGQMNEDRLSRVALLEQEVTKGKQKVEQSTLKMIFEQIPFVFLATIPLGSPLAKAEFQNFIKGYGMRISAWIGRKRAPPAPLVQWRRLGSREFFKDYEIGRPLDALVKVALPLATLEWLHMERKIAGSGEDLTPEEIEKAANN